MKLLTQILLISLILSLTSCQTILGYKPGYHRISFEKLSAKSFKKIGIELQLPEDYRVDYNTDDWLRVSLHTYYPQSMLVEYTATYFISVNKFTPEEYLHPRYKQQYINFPYFYEKTEHIQKERLNGRLRTNYVHLLIKHIRDNLGNIFVIEISIYPWPENKFNIQEDIYFGYKIIDSMKIL